MGAPPHESAAQGLCGFGKCGSFARVQTTFALPSLSPRQPYLVIERVHGWISRESNLGRMTAGP